MNIEITENFNSAMNSVIYFTNNEVHTFVYSCQFLSLEEEAQMMVTQTFENAKQKNINPSDINKIEIFISDFREMS